MNNTHMLENLARSLAIHHIRRRALLTAAFASFGAAVLGRSQIGASPSPTRQLSARASGAAFAGQIRVLVVEGFEHRQDGVSLEFFAARRGLAPCEPSTQTMIDRAKSQAVQAETQGVADELATLGVPEFEQVLEAWQALLKT